MKDELLLETRVSALGAVDRLHILQALSTPLTHSELAERLKQPLGVRHHLAILIDAGLVVKEKVDRRTVVYGRAEGVLVETISSLLEYIQRGV